VGVFPTTTPRCFRHFRTPTFPLFCWEFLWPRQDEGGIPLWFITKQQRQKQQQENLVATKRKPQPGEHLLISAAVFPPKNSQPPTDTPPPWIFSQCCVLVYRNYESLLSKKRCSAPLCAHVCVRSIKIVDFLFASLCFPPGFSTFLLGGKWRKWRKHATEQLFLIWQKLCRSFVAAACHFIIFAIRVHCGWPLKSWPSTSQKSKVLTWLDPLKLGLINRP